MHPRSVAPELLRFYRGFMQRASDEVGGGLALMTAPCASFVPGRARGRPACGLIVVYLGDVDRGREALRPLLEWGQPLAGRIGPIRYTALQALTDDSHPWGIHHYAKVDYLTQLPDAAVDVLVDHAERIASPHSQLLLCRLGGGVARMDRHTMALNIPKAEWAYFALASWWNPSGHEQHIGWARGVTEAMRPWSADAVPPNFMGVDEGPDRLRRFYGDERLKRLVALKDEYDRGNFFALNQNILPTHVAVASQPVTAQVNGGAADDRRSSRVGSDDLHGVTQGVHTS